MDQHIAYIRRVGQRMPMRFPEYLCGAVIFALGVIMFITPGVFDRGYFKTFLDIMPQGAWITVCLSVGTVRIIALMINGESPMVSIPTRLVGAILGTVIFCIFVGRAINASTPSAISLGVATYIGYAIIDLRNVYRTAIDALALWRIKRNAASILGP